MPKLALIALAVLLLLSPGCTVSSTDAGNRVQMIDNKDRYQYQFLGTVTGYSTMALTQAGEAQNATTEARNKAAKMGANAIKIIHVQITNAGATVLAEALRVDFSSRR